MATMTRDELDAHLVATVQRERGVVLHDYAEMARLDVWAERAGDVVATGEKKTRPDIHCTHYPTAVLDLAKWQNVLASEWSTGLASLVWYAWACGCVAEVRPSTGIPVVVDVTTPALSSVSLNAGVARPTVQIPHEAWTFLTVGDQSGLVAS